MEALDPLLDPWRSGLGRRALLEVVLLGLACGALSFWVVSYRLSYPAESLGHGLLPGLVLAALAGAPLLLGAGAGVAVAAVAVALAARDDSVGADTATAVVVTGLLGAGALLALAPEAPARLEELLFGDPLAVSDPDLVAAAVLTVAMGLALRALHRPLCAVALDAGGARALGVSGAWTQAALLGLLATALAVAVQGLGSLLVLALLVAPAVAAGTRRRGPGTAIVLGAGVGALAGIAGLYASYHLGGPAGASVALALCLAAATGTGARRVGGLRPFAATEGPAGHG